MQPPGGWGEYLLAELGIEWYRIPIVIASAVIIYLVFLVLVRIFGARVLTVTSGFDALVFIMLGAVAGRVILGHPPTVAAGVIGLVTLMTMEAIFGAIERTWASRRLISSRPVLVFAHGRPIEKACRRSPRSRDAGERGRRSGASVRRAALTRADHWRDRKADGHRRPIDRSHPRRGRAVPAVLTVPARRLSSVSGIPRPRVLPGRRPVDRRR